MSSNETCGISNIQRKIRYSALPYEVKSSFIRVLKETANPDLWDDLTSKLQFNEIQRNKIKRCVQQNIDNSAYSPFEDIIGIYEEADRTVRTLFITLGELDLLDAITELKSYVDEKYHGVIYGDFSNVSTSMTGPGPNISLLLKKSVSSNSSTSGTTSFDTSAPLSSNITETVPEIDYGVLERITKGWDKKYLLGEGGYGSVYFAKYINTDVAIKLIRVHSAEKNHNLSVEFRQSLNELRSLNQCRHINIIQIYGYSANIGKPYCLIYEYMKGGTLDDKLFNDRKPFPWKLRVDIMLDAARGLQFLHDFKKMGAIIHGDIKPANILLDEHMKAKIGDFGIARESTKAGKEISHIYGTRPYLPGEFITHKLLSTKVDSYSFGIVLFEVCTKKHVVDRSRRPIYLKELVEKHKDDILSLMDTSEGSSDVEIDIFKSLLEIGLECVKVEPSERLEMADVYKRLDKIFKVSITGTDE